MQRNGSSSTGANNGSDDDDDIDSDDEAINAQRIARVAAHATATA
jgi:hypothetical protein